MIAGSLAYPLRSPPYRAYQRRVELQVARCLRPVCDGHGWPLIMPLSEGQMSDFKGAALMIYAFPKAKT